MSNMECPICMDAIDVTKNSVVTDCGHAFHCSCLMQNTAHNGFGCPYCRTAMANQPPVEDDEESTFSQVNQEIGNYSLTSFRMFMQRLNGEEPEEDEEEEEDDWETDEDEEEQEEPDATYMTAKLMERGITYEDLVKNILFAEHSNFGESYREYDRRCGEVYGQFRAIISRYNPDEDVPVVPPTHVEVPAQRPIIVVPEVAETKTIPSRREYMCHV